MSDYTAPPARPVSLFTIVFLLAVFAAFLLVIRYFYHPTQSSTFGARPDNLSKDLDWRASSETRRATLVDQRKTEAAQASGYGWADQKTGVVQLPINRAMELTAQDYAARQQTRSLPSAPSTPPPKR